MKNVVVFDNKGKSFDRYTIIIGSDAYGMSHNPKSPLGYTTYLGKAKDYNHAALGEEIALKALSKEIREAIKERERQ